MKNRGKSLGDGLLKMIDFIFNKECELYRNFIAVYKNIKKTTEEEQDS